MQLVIGRVGNPFRVADSRHCRGWPLRKGEMPGQRGIQTKSTLDILTDKVSRIQTVIDSAVALITGLTQHSGRM